MYSIGGKAFSSKDQIAFVCKAILNSTEPGVILDRETSAMIFDVLSMHPYADEKIGVGVQAFGVQRNPQYGKKEFVVYRTDGSSTEFSYLKCLKSRTNKADFTQALRQAVAGGIIAFQRQYFKQAANPVCPLTGITLTPQNSHVDHIHPQTFSSLVEGFVRGYKMDINSVELLSGGDNNCIVQLKDKYLEKAWIEYHWRYAQLRVVSARANLAMSDKGETALEPMQGLLPEWIYQQAHEDMKAMGYTCVRYGWDKGASEL